MLNGRVDEDDPTENFAPGGPTFFTTSIIAGFTWRYSGTSDKQHSELGTTSLQRVPCFNPMLINTLVHFLTFEIGTTSLGPIVSLVRRFHCSWPCFFWQYVSPSVFLWEIV